MKTPIVWSWFAVAWTSVAVAGEAGRGGVYSVVEIPFTGPTLTAKDAPGRDVDLQVSFRHEGGTEYTIPGFWDGDGHGGTNGGVYKVRFCPTKPGRWELTAVRSNAKQLDNQRQGDHVTATPSAHHGFWEVDADSPGRRWYKRSDGSHQYVVGNTEYSFLSGMKKDGPVPGFDLAADVAANAGYFK